MEEKVYCKNCVHFIKALTKHNYLLNLRVSYDTVDLKYRNKSWVRESSSFNFSFNTPICIANTEAFTTVKENFESKNNYVEVIVDDPQELNCNNSCTMFTPKLTYTVYNKVNNFFKEFVA